ncbi:MAG: peptidoglycan/LPS O-acetylase OafA/YrhL [Oceanicoccus sp.]
MKAAIITIDHSPKLSFRSDIEGLRGLAVLLVMMYHFKSPLISGGYIGVDVFFVISGFLIASIISSAIDQDNFSLAHFYERRLKRLMPALVIACLVALIIFSFILIPQDYTLFLKSLKDIFLFKSNLFFLEKTEDYFSPAGELMPMLHTWSLSLEWQFYFVLPAFILLSRKYLGNKRACYSLFIVSIGFIILSMATTPNNPAAYFLFGPRFFEFLLGACAAFIRIRLPFGELSKNLSIVGLIACSILYTKSTVFPGINALWVCLFTVLFICNHQTSKIFSQPLFSWLGKVSYSAYLYHWLLVVALVYLGVEIKNWYFIPLTAITLLIAFLSYQYIESPLRRSQGSLAKVAAIYLLLPLLVIFTLLHFAKQYDGIPQRLGNNCNQAYQAISNSDNLQRHRCHSFQTNDISQCLMTDSKGKQTALLLGDSHASHYWTLASELAIDADIKIYGRTSSSCLFSPNVAQYEKGPLNQNCRNYVADAIGLMAQLKPDYVLISQRWLGYGQSIFVLDQGEKKPTTISLEQSVKNTIDMIISTGAIPVFILPIAENGIDASKCFYRQLRLGSDAERCHIVEGGYQSQQITAIETLLKNKAADYPQLILIDPKQAQCDQARCISSAEGLPFYDDAHHINDFAAEWLARKIITHSGNPLKTE